MDHDDFTFCENSNFDPFAEDWDIDDWDAAEGEGVRQVINIPTINANMNENMQRKKNSPSAKVKDAILKKYSSMSTSSNSKLTLRQQISDLLRAWASVKNRTRYDDFQHDIRSNYLLNIKNKTDILSRRPKDDFITMKQIPKLD